MSVIDNIILLVIFIVHSVYLMLIISKSLGIKHRNDTVSEMIYYFLSIILAVIWSSAAIHLFKWIMENNV